MDWNPSALKAKADAYINERVAMAGQPFPLEGQHRELCVVLMAGFACDVVIAELQFIAAEKSN